MNFHTMHMELAEESDTERLGKQLAASLEPGCVIYLWGELGAGKTRLARAIIHGLGHKGNVKSPTYNLVEPYALANHQVFHFDLYRLTDPMELDFMGIQDYFDKDNTVLIEWPDRGKGMLKKPDIEVYLSYLNLGRSCEIKARTELGNELLQELKLNL